nr:hypothetical protein [Verrucomicrobiota bacterium]
AADQQIDFELVEPGSFQSGLVSKFDAVVFDNFLPAGFDLGQSAGNLFFLKRSPLSTSGETLEQPLVTDVESAHPALRMVNLQNVTIIRAQAAEIPREAPGGWKFDAPLRSFDRPLLITGSRRTDTGTQRLAALTFDLGESDLPLRVAFPLLMTNTLHWLAGERSEARNSLPAGEMLSLPDGQTVWTKPQTRADLPVNPAPAELATGFFRPEKNGYYLVGPGERSRWLAVNTFRESESDLRVPQVETAPRLRLPGVGLGAFTGWPIWHYLALAAFALFTVEWWLFHRRRTE